MEVRDRATGAAAARGVTGASEHESHLTVEMTASDSLRLQGDWPRELPGRHTVTVRKPGYQTEYIDVFVDSDECHVEPQTVEATITPEPLAQFEEPLSFAEGPGIDAYPANAGLELLADTLLIAGWVPTGCSELTVVAARVNSSLHIQVEPSDVALPECLSPRRFEARFLLPAERTYLLVTNGYSFPVVLFNGQVRPS